MGKLDNTLIIYIGDNGSSAKGTLIGTPNEVASLNGVSVPIEDQLKFFYVQRPCSQRLRLFQPGHRLHGLGLLPSAHRDDSPVSVH
jgi:hypothetical protein